MNACIPTVVERSWLSMTATNTDVSSTLLELLADSTRSFQRRRPSSRQSSPAGDSSDVTRDLLAPVRDLDDGVHNVMFALRL